MHAPDAHAPSSLHAAPAAESVGTQRGGVLVASQRAIPSQSASVSQSTVQ